MRGLTLIAYPSAPEGLLTLEMESRLLATDSVGDASVDLASGFIGVSIPRGATAGAVLPCISGEIAAMGHPPSGWDATQKGNSPHLHQPEPKLCWR